MSSFGTTQDKGKREQGYIGKAIRMALESGAPNVDLSKLPDLKDMSVETITENVKLINAGCEDKRLKFVMEKLVQHLHDFTREVGLTSAEWMAAIQFLTKTGQICTDLRQEYILLSDIFGLSALVDSLNHPKPQNATEATVLGPFFVEDSADVPNGESIASEGKGEYLYVHGKVTDTSGKPVPNAIIETWETDQEGFYDTQYSDRTEADCRGRLRTDEQGNYSFRGVKPVPYPIPNDGPVGQLLRKLGRHVFRPAHIHFMIMHPEYEKLITALYPEGDPYISSDAVFGVKSSLQYKYGEITDEAECKRLGFLSGPVATVEWDFVLCTEEEGEQQRRKTLKGFYESSEQ